MSFHCKEGTWSVHFIDNAGKKCQKSCGKGEAGRQLAEKLDMEIKARKKAIREAMRNDELIASTAIPVSVPEAVNVSIPEDIAPAITFEKLVNEYLANSQVNGSTEDHRKSITYVAEKLFYPYFGRETPINRISYSDILGFMTWIENENSQNGRKRFPITINRYGHFLSAFFRYAVDLGYLDKNPMTRWKPKKIPPKEVKLTREGFQKIWENAAPHLQWALEVEYHLGLRSGPSELLSLKWDDIDFDKREVRIYASKTKTWRTIPINDERFLDRLWERRNMAVSPYVIEYNGKQVKSLKRSFNRAVELAGLPYPVRMYDVRHLFATMLLSNGATIGAVSALLGHSRTATTLNVYYHTTKHETVTAIEKLPAL